MKLFHHKKVSHRNDSHEMKEALMNIGHEPHIDWVLIIVVSVITCAVLVVNGYFAFGRVGKTISQAPAAAGAQQASIDSVGLTKILEQFQMRDRERQDLIRTYGGPGDPSR